jgi:hypothetical protein
MNVSNFHANTNLNNLDDIASNQAVNMAVDENHQQND